VVTAAHQILQRSTKCGSVRHRNHKIGAAMERSNNQTEKPEVLAIDVPTAGAMARMSRVRSYIAAKDGSMPTIKVAGRLKVPLKAWRAKLNGEAA
jgi:hypothetical protein